ncbi:MAG: DUF5683 domain-containing protein [Bacteroidia bacterium]
MINKTLVSFLLYLFISTSLLGQPLKNEPNKHSPKKATLYSLIPGGGQIYNRKYWKVPIIYAGFAALAYSTYFNNTEYNRFKTAYRQSVAQQPITDPELANVPQQMLRNTREFYQKNRDLSVIGIAGLYALNLIDAAVDAHLKQFDVSDNLSLRIKPTINYNFGFATTSVQLQLNLH